MSEDILTHTVRYYWEWIAEFHPVFVFLLVRWALWMLLIAILGLFARRLKPPRGSCSLVVQTGICFIATLAAFTTPIYRIEQMSLDYRNFLLSLAIMGWILLPYLVPKIIVRRLGFQQITGRILYGLELLLLLAQGAILFFRREPCGIG